RNQHGGQEARPRRRQEGDPPQPRRPQKVATRPAPQGAGGGCAENQLKPIGRLRLIASGQGGPARSHYKPEAQAKGEVPFAGASGLCPNPQAAELTRLAAAAGVRAAPALPAPRSAPPPGGATRRP